MTRLQYRGLHEEEVVGFPYSYFPPLSVDTGHVRATAGISSPRPCSQTWIDVRPLSPTTPESPDWVNVQPLRVMSSSASIFSSQSRAMNAKEHIAELRSRLYRNISFNRSRPVSMISDSGSSSSGSVSPSSETAPSPTISKFRSIPSPISPLIGQPSLSPIDETKRYTAFDEPVPGWARVMAEKEDLAMLTRQISFEDVVDTEDRLGDMVDSLNGRPPRMDRGRPAHRRNTSGYSSSSSGSSF